MSKLFIKQFEMVRGWSIEVAESVSKEIANIQPDGFNNTIHWHIGHILTATERFMYEIFHHKTHLPANYVELFGADTKPSDWKQNVPTVDELIIGLKDQLVRLQQMPTERYHEKLEKPFFGFETFGECAGFAIAHEALHIGKMEEMKRVIEHAGSKN